ncbi:MAG TPA: phage holin family protein [Vicinamibacterales bacterium]|nr:phage holin family protein [Vicinamibacterales bacterium]
MAAVPQDDRFVNRPRSEGRPLSALFSDLWRESSTLAQQEAELAKAELHEKLSRLTAGVGEIATGGAVLLAGFIVLLFAAVAALEQVLPEPHDTWLAPLIVGAVVMIIGFIAVGRGRANLKAENLAPERTLQSLSRDANLAKEHMK